MTFGSVDSTQVTGQIFSSAALPQQNNTGNTFGGGGEPTSVAANEFPVVDSWPYGATRFGEGYDCHLVWRKWQYITVENIIGSWVSFNLSWISLCLIFIASKQFQALIFAFSISMKKTTESEIQKTLITVT